ncbi:MAG: hypothetical protein CL774_03205 [Chloroflexi bacterium]|nr:hypothetical protein [Chloroflexota bacterium]|tara:strand:+ start:13726 stop:14049 length:324 start_codon:yes stop_codon:yes gene_type:complete
MLKFLRIFSLSLGLLRLAWRLFLDKRIPKYKKIIPLIGFLYLINPIDLIKDYILVLGFIDDLIVLFGLIILFVVTSPGKIIIEKLTFDNKKQNEKTMNAEYEFIDEE